jgi:hypothetical protein
MDNLIESVLHTAEAEAREDWLHDRLAEARAWWVHVTELALAVDEEGAAEEVDLT